MVVESFCKKVNCKFNLDLSDHQNYGPSKMYGNYRVKIALIIITQIK
jgi:hypothetical protein